MRHHVLLFAFVLVVCSSNVVGVPRAESAEPTASELQQQLAAMLSRVAGLEAEVAALRARLDERDGGVPSVAGERELEDLVASAEREAGAEAPADSEGLPAFTSGALGLQALNPEISVTGDFISSYRSGDAVAANFDNTLRNLGLHFESYLDPYSRFKAAIPVTDATAKIGEAYFTRYGWMPNLSVTLGRFRQQLGVVNRWHKHALDQVDFPLPLRQIFGPGGLNQTGASLEWQLPSWGDSAQELTLQVTDGENGRVFGDNADNALAVLAHYKNYRDLDKDTYLEFGLTGLRGRNDTWDVLVGDEVVPQREDLWSDVLSADLTLFWEPTEQMRYRNWLWRTEAYWLNKRLLAPDGSGEDAVRAWGFYTNYQRKLDRTREAGLRVDYYEPGVKGYANLPGLSLAPLAVTESGAHQWLIAPYFTWWQSPWVRWRLEWDHQINRHMGPEEDAIYLQCTYAAGPHKHERY